MGEKKEGIWKEIFDGDGIRGLMRELTREEREEETGHILGWGGMMDSGLGCGDNWKSRCPEV